MLQLRITICHAEIIQFVVLYLLQLTELITFLKWEFKRKEDRTLEIGIWTTTMMTTTTIQFSVQTS